VNISAICSIATGILASFASGTRDSRLWPSAGGQGLSLDFWKFWAGQSPCAS
jgi:hypothetical protein